MASDHDLLQGFWKLESMTKNGVPFEHPDVGTLIQFVGNRYRHIRSRVSYRFELNEDTTPKGFDEIHVSTGNVCRGLYELIGDILMIQKGLAWNKDRPTNFSDSLVPTERYVRFKRRIKVKARVKAQVPAEYFASLRSQKS